MRTLQNWFGLRCRLMLCPHRWHDDETGIGGQCVDCGKISAWVTRDELREIGDRAWERKP